MREIVYIGCFFSREEVMEKAARCRKDRLYRSIENPHVTFAYRPDTIPYEAFGTPVAVTVVSYGCDGENESFGVMIGELPEVLQPLAQAIEVPHITISVSKTGKPVNSRYVTCEPIEPFVLRGVFGGMGADRKVYTKKER